MSSEQAQRLVALSLNKIQNARGRKTGLNLHRSLLVSSVLFKAKTAIIMAKYNMKSEYETIEDTDDEVESEENDDQLVPDIDDECDSSESDDLSLDSPPTDSKPDSDFDNKENDPPQVSPGEWEENNVLCQQSSSKDNVLAEEKKDIRCNKCVKRRLTEVESAVESITKKQCTDSDNCEPETDSHQPMECVQITNLVDSFHCGFSGLLTENQSNVTSQEPRGQLGLSEAFNSCSTQIKDALAVASPILLSV